MNDTALMWILLIAINALTCGVAYLMGHKSGLRDGFDHARRARILAKNANA